MSRPVEFGFEPLESRRLLSASLGGAFSGNLPPVLTPFGSQSIHLRVSDTGTGPLVGSVTAQVYASPQPALGPDAVLLATNSRVVHLHSGQMISLPVRFAAPSGLAEGSYFLVGKIAGPSGESTAFAGSQPIPYQPPFVSLSGQLRAPPGGFTTQNGHPASGTLSVLVHNAGNVPAQGTLALRLFGSPDAVLDDTDPPLATVPARFVNVRPGGTTVLTVRARLPAATTPGDYYVFASLGPAPGMIGSFSQQPLTLVPARLKVVSAPVPVATAINDGHGHHHRPHQNDRPASLCGCGGAGFAGDIFSSGVDLFSPDPDPGDNGGGDVTTGDSSGMDGGGDNGGSDNGNGGGTDTGTGGSDTAPSDPGSSGDPGSMDDGGDPETDMALARAPTQPASQPGGRL